MVKESKKNGYSKRIGLKGNILIVYNVGKNKKTQCRMEILNPYITAQRPTMRLTSIYHTLIAEVKKIICENPKMIPKEIRPSAKAVLFFYT